MASIQIQIFQISHVNIQHNVLCLLFNILNLSRNSEDITIEKCMTNKEDIITSLRGEPVQKSKK